MHVPLDVGRKQSHVSPFPSKPSPPQLVFNDAISTAYVRPIQHPIKRIIIANYK
jgi:hypothetical protein